MELCFKGYMQGHKDRAINVRYTIVKELLSYGADPNTYKYETRMSPLHWAAFNKDPKTCQVLLNKGADAERMNIQDQLPIDVAGYTPSLTCVDVFLQKYLERFDILGRDIAQSKIQKVSRARGGEVGKSAKKLLKQASMRFPDLYGGNQSESHSYIGKSNLGQHSDQSQTMENAFEVNSDLRKQEVTLQTAQMNFDKKQLKMKNKGSLSAQPSQEKETKFKSNKNSVPDDKSLPSINENSKSMNINVSKVLQEFDSSLSAKDQATNSMGEEIKIDSGRLVQSNQKEALQTLQQLKRMKTK